MRHSFHVKAVAALISGAVCAFAWTMPPARAATAENFTVRTTADLVTLCETQPGQENYVAAIHFCQGFASGAYQYYLAVARNDPALRFVCLPDPPPTRNDAIAAFLAWVRANPSALEQPAVESMFRYLGQTYPCSAAQRAPG